MTELPRDIEAEKSVLAAMILDPKCIQDVAGILVPSSFWSVSHQLTFKALLSLEADSVPVDLISLSGRLRESGDLEAAGGGQFLASLMEYSLTSANVLHHARIVRAKDGLRRLSEAASRLESLARSESPPESILESVEAIRELAEGKTSDESVHISDGLMDLLTSNPRPFVQMPLDSLSGIRVVGGDLCCFAARPGAGKTVILTDIALSVARSGRWVQFASLEMSKSEIQQRLLASGWSLPLAEVMYPDGTASAVIKAASSLAKMSINVKDLSGKSRLDVEDICSLARGFHRKHPDMVLIVDYLQLVGSRMRIERRHELIGHVCRELKRLAINLDIPVIVAAQLGRDYEKRGIDAKPRLSDLRESGDIENTCQEIILMHNAPDRFHMRVAKNRMGRKFTAEVKFNEECTRFEEFGWQ